MKQESLIRNGHAIGMFDSGVGGLTVMHEVMRTLPKESLIYFADTARIPYGEKSRETIIRYSIENSIFLMEKEVKLLVVACNTASAYALESLRKIFNIPIIGVIEAGAEKAVQKTRNKQIAVLGTRGTVNSGTYQQEIQKRLPGAIIHAIPCPLLVPMIEEKWIDHSVTKQVVKEYLAPLKKLHIDTLLLGCTHYPLLRDLFQAEMGDDVIIVDSASTCAEAVQNTLKAQNLLSPGSGKPDYRYFVTDDPQKFKNLSKEFLSIAVDNVSAASHLH
jgi:glutamate racemase